MRQNERAVVTSERLHFALAGRLDRWQSAFVSPSLAPGFLVASPSMRCPFFNHTLVLLVDHGDEGSFGFVLNRTTDLDMGDIFEEVGVEPKEASLGESPVLLGGPVSPETGWILYDAAGVPAPESGRTIAVGDRIACSASIEMLHRIATGNGPETCAMVLGYAGWGAGQLEHEMVEGSWIPVDLDYRLVFETPIDARWESALASLGIEPGHVIDNRVGSA
ncbi:MAG: YqgE/AlgH family protein [Myxococcota bacterium]